MQRFNLNKETILILIFLGMGIFGAIFFFPVNFDNQYTCLYHRLFFPEHSYHYSNEDIVSHYIRPFGYLWWTSLLLLALSIYGLRRQVVAKTRKSQTDPPTLENRTEM